jgi:hypothetical protein
MEDHDRMLGDERRRPGVVGETRDAARPHALSYVDRGGDEVERDGGGRIDQRGRVGFRPTVVMLGHREKDRGASRMLVKRDAVLHDLAGKRGVIGLCDQLECVTSLSNDHGKPADRTMPIER